MIALLILAVCLLLSPPLLALLRKHLCVHQKPSLIVTPLSLVPSALTIIAQYVAVLQPPFSPDTASNHLSPLNTSLCEISSCI